MRVSKLTICILAGFLFSSSVAFGLSREIGRDIEFPKDFDQQKARAILEVVRDKKFDFRDGYVSYWPPDWGTRLSFVGDTTSLTEFLVALRGVQGMGLRLVLYDGRDDEGRRDSAWQLYFSHAHPDQLTVYVNLKAKSLDLSKLKLPDWPAA